MQINLKNLFKDDYLTEFVEVFLEKESNQERKKLLIDVKFEIKKSEEKYFVRKRFSIFLNIYLIQFIFIHLKICFILNPPYYVKNYKGTISFYTKGDCSLEKVDKNFNFETTDLYTPNKKAIIFKDIIQVINLFYEKKLKTF